MPIANKDDDTIQPLAGLALPWTLNPTTSWDFYLAWVEILLDPGMVLHKTLPQNPDNVDTLATQFFREYEFKGNPDANVGSGVNMHSESSVLDTIQRMATSTYRFILKGHGRRAGFQVPVPGLLSVGGQTPVPCFPQWSSGNIIVGNLAGGIPLFYCAWQLHYIVPGGPLSGVAPIPPNLTARVRADQDLPQTIQVPAAPLDNNAISPQAPVLGFFVGGGGQPPLRRGGLGGNVGGGAGGGAGGGFAP